MQMADMVGSEKFAHAAEVKMDTPECSFLFDFGRTAYSRMSNYLERMRGVPLHVFNLQNSWPIAVQFWSNSRHYF